jgi:hypothetical protein
MPGGAGTAAATRLGRGAEAAARTGFYRGLTDVSSEASLAAAKRQPMMIARSLNAQTLVGRSVRGAALGGAVGAGTAAAQGGDVTRGAELGVLGGAVGNAALGSRLGRAATEKLPGGFVSNHPLQARTSPLVGKLTDEDGLYYQARSLLASPYRVPIIRGAGNAYAQAIPFGLGAAGQSALASHYDPTNDLTNAIASDTTLDPLDQRLQAFTSGLTGHHVALGLNDLAWFLHGDIPLPGQKGAASAGVGRAVDALSDHANDALGTVGANGAIQRAMQMVDPKWTPQRMIDTTFEGNAGVYNLFWTRRIDQLAVVRHAEQAVQRWVEDNGGAAPSYDQAKEIKATAAHEAWNDPEIRKEHFNALTASGNPASTGELERRLRAQLVGNIQEPEMAQRHGAAAYMRASNEAEAIVKDAEAMKSLISPASWETLSQQRLAATKAGDFGTAKIPTRAWLGANSLLSVPGATGMARLDTLSQPAAMSYISDLENKLNDENLDEAGRFALVSEAHTWLSHHGNFDAGNLAVFHHHPGTDGEIPLIERMRDYARGLGAPIHLAVDAPKELRDAVERMKADGYQLWHGTDIGHHLYSTDVPLSLGAQGISKGRKIVEHLGGNPEHYASTDIAAYRRDALRVELDAAMKDGRLPAPPFMTADNLITRIRSMANDNATLGPLKGAVFEATQAWRKTLVQAQAQAQGKTPPEVIAQMKNELAEYHDLRAIPRAEVHRILVSTEDLPYATALSREVQGEDHLPLFTPEQADLVHQLIIKAASRTPARMIGLSRLDDLIRAGFGLGGQDWGGPIGQMGTRIGNRAALVGNKYGQLRDNFRFTMSPSFSARRVTKTRIKLQVAGIDSTATPVKDLLESNSYEDAHRFYAKLFPEHADPAADEFDRALHSADIFAIYQPRQYAAHAAWQAKGMGWDDQRIKDMLTKSFEYGTQRHGEGRTALERTVNTIFFPFSFEKTVVRNIGGYLLDHPAQLMALNSGLAAYEQFSAANPSDPLSGDYLKAHVPLLNEILRLNPFAHGLSPGEFGGINAPLLNLFLPQSWDQSNPNSLGLLGRLVPAMNDANRVWKETGQQSVIAHSALQNVYDYASDKKATNPFFRYKPIITPQAQQTAAFKDRAKLLKTLGPVLDANRHLGPDHQYTFGDDPIIDPALRGEPVSKAAVDQLLHEIYPAYDPAGAAKYATTVKTNSKSFLDSIKDKPTFVPYAQFAKAVDTFRGYVQNGDYRDYPGQQAQLTAALRSFAFAAAANGDKGFVDWYNATFQKTLGPLTGAP